MFVILSPPHDTPMSVLLLVFFFFLLALIVSLCKMMDGSCHIHLMRMVDDVLMNPSTFFVERNAYKLFQQIIFYMSYLEGI